VLNKRLYLGKLLFLHVTVQQQGSIVFVVVLNLTKGLLLLVWGSNQLLKVLNQVIQLRHLDESLNHVTRVEVADCLHIFCDGLVVTFLRVKFVCVFFVDFSNNFHGESA
jgi:hypothetical protein